LIRFQDNMLGYTKRLCWLHQLIPSLVDQL
jgi:uncharacterized protein YhbP (UPF0306 family)